METELFNRQYIISEKELALDGWKQFLFDNYHVYVHPNLDYVHQDGKHLSVAVLGYLDAATGSILWSFYCTL